MQSRQFLKHCYHHCLVTLFLILCGTAAVAQPSGGPYGPIERSYPIPSAGTVYYVAPDGDASAPGLSLQKPTSIEAAISRVVTGDAIVMRGGVYRTGNLEFNQGISIQPYENEKPVFKGTQVASQWQSHAKNVWHTQWKTLFPSKPLPWWRRERNEHLTPLHRFNNDMVFIDGRFLQSAGSIKELTRDTYYIDYAKQQVYIGVDPKDHTVEITAYDTALLRTTEKVHGKSNDKIGPKIYGITFTQYAWRALGVEGQRRFTPDDEPVDDPIGIADPATYGKEVIGTLLENITISFCSRVAGYFRGDGLVIRNSLISDTSTEGIYIIASSDVLLERNIIMRNDMERITGYFVSAVKIINQTHNVTVRDNLVLDHPTSRGVWYDVGNRDGVFINNYVENTEVGFFFEISRGVTVAGNVFNNNEMGMWILNSADAALYNNTFINSTARFRRDTRSAQGDHFDWHPATGPDVFEREGHIFVNNLLVSSDDYEGPLVLMQQAPELCDQYKGSQIEQMDGNVYVRNPAAGDPLIVWPAPAKDSCSEDVASLKNLQQLEPKLELHGHVMQGSPRSLFIASDLKRFGLQRALPSEKSLAMPENVRKLLGWSKKAASQTVGAYPVK
ncbi:parallel beta-helix repeat protein [Alteromonadaceae bacterium 2753L.S.0a.02]|nr:parallel beta-helix repeat protein [Alteromonadaceae bacterium 2753L.S.0a.02]